VSGLQAKARKSCFSFLGGPEDDRLGRNMSPSCVCVYIYIYIYHCI